MSTPFLIIAVWTITAAVAAMTLRNLIHCALAVAMAFVGLAATYLSLNAQFVGFAQILVYVGAVAILIVFAVLLTRGGEPSTEVAFSKSWLVGIGVALAVFGVLAWAVAKSFLNTNEVPSAPVATVKQIGDALMTKFVLPLEVVGLLLTAAMIGAVIIAMRDESRKAKIEDGRSKMDKSVAPSSILHPPSSQGGHS
jgi:NADH:ubiquinone oxidoreductase subunit 6 (subunit J)